MDTRDVLLIGVLGAIGYFLYEQINATQTTVAPTAPLPPMPVSTIPNQDENGEEIQPDPVAFPPAQSAPTYDHILAVNPETVMSTSPMGIRNNNPGNLRPNGTEANYPTMQAGILAALNNLIAYTHLHGLRTIRGIITRWAPPNENNTAAYITYVSSQTGFGPDQTLNTSDPATAYKILMAIFSDENAGQTPDASLVHSVVASRLGAFA